MVFGRCSLPLIALLASICEIRTQIELSGLEPSSEKNAPGGSNPEQDGILSCHLMTNLLPKPVRHVSEQVSTMFEGHTWGEGSRHPPTYLQFLPQGGKLSVSVYHHPSSLGAQVDGRFLFVLKVGQSLVPRQVFLRLLS